MLLLKNLSVLQWFAMWFCCSLGENVFHMAFSNGLLQSKVNTHNGHVSWKKNQDMRKQNPEFCDDLFFSSSPQNWIGGGGQFASSKIILVVQIRSFIELLKLQVMHEHKLWVAYMFQRFELKNVSFAQGKHLLMCFLKQALYRTAI